MSKLQREATHCVYFETKEAEYVGNDPYASKHGGSYLIFQEAGMDPIWYEFDNKLVCFWEPCAGGLRKHCFPVDDVGEIILTRYSQKEGAWK